MTLRLELNVLGDYVAEDAAIASQREYVSDTPLFICLCCESRFSRI